MVLSQRDKRWASKKLGFSTLTIGNYGCTLTCLTMWLNGVLGTNYTPDEVNDRLKQKGAYSGALLLWGNIPKAFPVKFVKRARNYNNLDVARYVYLKRLPVMVEVSGAKIGTLRHWVLFTGGRRALDPWTGKEISTGVHLPTGYALMEQV